MGRKSSKQARFDRLSQRGQRKEMRRNQTKPKDGRDWATKLMKKLNEGAE